LPLSLTNLECGAHLESLKVLSQGDVIQGKQFSHILIQWSLRNLRMQHA